MSVLSRMVKCIFWTGCLCLQFMMFARASATEMSYQDERIIEFESTLRVQTHRALQVEENLLVDVRGDKIRHGIYRDIPARLSDRFLNKREPSFRILGVRLNNAAVPYTTQKLGNNMTRIKIGDPASEMNPGVYLYTIKYLMLNQVKECSNQNELYFNIIGNSWELPIDCVRAIVVAPTSNVEYTSLEAFSGKFGSVDQGHSLTNNDGNLFFEIQRRLYPGEGFTVRVRWAGKPSPARFSKEGGELFFKENHRVIEAQWGILFLLVYFIIVWFLVGRDGKRGKIEIRGDVPENLSPAAIRYIKRMGYDETCLTAALVQLAADGCITMTQIGERSWLFKKNVSSGWENHEILRMMFPEPWNEFKLGPETRILWLQIQDTLRRDLKGQYGSKMFKTNRCLVLPAVLIALITMMVSLVSLGNSISVLLAMGLILLFSGLSALAYFVFRKFRRLYSSYSHRKSSSFINSSEKVIVFVTLAVCFLVASIPVLYFLASLIGSFLLIVLLLDLLTIGVFMFLLKTPTVRGRQLRDQIEGYRRFLLNMDHHVDLQTMKHPVQLSVYEKHISYAIALGVEYHYAKQFQFGDVRKGGIGRPDWVFSDHFLSNGVAHFGDSLSFGLNETLSRASLFHQSSNPFYTGGSSGGYSGGGSSGGVSSSGSGGFSGGGGGGGGGGGW